MSNNLISDYLTKQDYSPRTIAAHQRRIRDFNQWRKKRKLKYEEVKYKHIIKYAEYLQNRKSYGRGATNNSLRAVKLYFDSLNYNGEVVGNPANQVVIRGKRELVNHNVLSEEELEDLYYSLKSEHHDRYFNATAKRDKTIAGLLIYQGVKANELYKIHMEHLEIERGRIYISGSKKSNGRSLILKSWQMVALMEYVKDYRDYLGQKHKSDHSEQLYHSTRTTCNNHVARITKKFKQINRKVESPNQIRASVIVNWLKRYNLRKVQVMVGHKSISSTERYLQNDIENLHKMVDEFHPMK